MSGKQRPPSTPRAAPPRRRRRRDEARAAILRAAEQRLIEGGPEAIRLQELAADVGVSHPTILHHFGSRDGLVEALVEHAMDGLQQELIGLVEDAVGDPRRSHSDRVERSARMLERTSEVFERRGYARLLAWLLLSGHEIPRPGSSAFGSFPKVVHAARIERKRSAGEPVPTLEDTLCGSVMVMLVLFADALMGDDARRAVGLRRGRRTAERFRLWLAHALEKVPPVFVEDEPEP